MRAGLRFYKGLYNHRLIAHCADTSESDISPLPITHRAHLWHHSEALLSRFPLSVTDTDNMGSISFLLSCYLIFRCLSPSVDYF